MKTATRKSKPLPKDNSKHDAKPKLVNITLLTSTQLINASIDSIAKRGKTLQADIHITACSILAHTESHGDITLANRLIEALPTLARKNAMREWFIAFGKFTYSMETKQLVYSKGKKTDTMKATAAPFWEFKPEAEFVPFDLEQAVTSLLIKAQKRREQGDKRDKIQPKLIAVLQTIAKKDALAA